MKVCIDSSSLGTQNCLVVDTDGSCQWQKSPHDCDAHLGSNLGVSIESLAQMQGFPEDILSLSDSSQIRAFQALGVDSHSVPWLVALGEQKFISRLKKITASIQDVTRDTEVVRYVETYRKGNKILESLQRARIDINRMRHHRAHIDGGQSPLSALASFSPSDGEFAPPVRYDRASSATGRLTVTQGPSILTLQKECRDIIVSQCGGSIYEIDFVSLEPRVALNIMGINPPRDIYEGIRERMQMSNITRAATKQAVISSLYGSSSSLLAESLGGRWEALQLIKEVKKYFRVPDMISRLRSEMSIHKNRLHNYYGRPLVHVSASDTDAKIISHYLQSTAVDVALLGFSAVCERLKTLGALPIYVIHDALLIDVPQDSQEQFFSDCASGIDLDIGHFEISCNKISR